MKLNKLNFEGSGWTIDEGKGNTCYEVSFYLEKGDYINEEPTTQVLYVPTDFTPPEALRPIAVKALMYLYEEESPLDAEPHLFHSIASDDPLDVGSDGWVVAMWKYSSDFYLANKLEYPDYPNHKRLRGEGYTDTRVSPETLERLVDEVLQDRLPTLPYNSNDSKLNGFIQEHGILERD
jgi:hypothetical protein